MIVAQGRPVRLTLSRDLVRALRRGHPWVFADALAARPPAPPGSPALLCDKRGRPIVQGFYEPDSPLAFRACTQSARQAADDAWAAQGLEGALSLRRALIDPSTTTGYRLVNGEGDGLPGLVVDVYGDAAAVRLDGPGAAAFWRGGEGVGAWLAEQLGVRQVYVRERGRAGAEGEAVVGEIPAGPAPFTEHGVRFTADLVRGQKTGFFLDQRENRRRIGQVAAGRRALNVFGYTGGFSVYAGVGGADHVTTVDLAAPAVEAANAHWLLNDLDPARHAGVAQDAFAFLEAAAAAGERWDLVVLDPPSFAPRQSAAPQAIAAYTRLIAAGARVTAPGGLMAAASCSSHVDLGAFMGAIEEGIAAARRCGRVLEVAGQPPDHPAPLPLTEFRYLKFVLLAVL